MQPLILAEQTRQGVADFLASTFPATTGGFGDLLTRFLAEPERLAKGPYVSVGLPFRRSIGGADRFEWLTNFIAHSHQAQAFARLAGSAPRSTIVATGTGSGKTECFLYRCSSIAGRNARRGARGSRRS